MGPRNKTGVAVLIFDKINLKPKPIRGDKGHFLFLKGKAKQDITVLNIYASNTAAHIFIKESVRIKTTDLSTNTVISVNQG